MSPPWRPPEAGEPVPWARIEASLRLAARSAHPFKISRRVPEDSRRAAVAVVLWGDAEGASKLVLVQRGHGAPHHPGEIAFPGGMVEARDPDLPRTARRELAEELGITDIWEIGCFPDGVAKARVRFTPVLFRWEAEEPRFTVDAELERALMLPLAPLLDAPWSVEVLDRQGLAIDVPRLELDLGDATPTPLWGATAFVLKAWLDALAAV
ncbi:MAG TPA: NUDIX domain-containing protein [Holophagaceae bacterium]|nr:NUDIX domain-containing protein [Holophagaceae bacterium]